MNPQKKRILIIEDDPDILELMQYNLQKHGYLVDFATDGELGRQKAQALLPDLILLDIMLPTLDGHSVCTELKRNPATKPIPIIILTAKSDEADIVIGLELGADDYMKKPFSNSELLARIKALLRRSSAPKAADLEPSGKPEQISVGPIMLDLGRHEIYCHGEELVFTLTEFNLLQALMRKPGRVFTREQLLEQIAGSETYLIDRNIDVHIRAIRKKLGDEAHHISTVRGVGYKWKD